jgi:hypothetical protein
MLITSSWARSTENSLQVYKCFRIGAVVQPWKVQSIDQLNEGDELIFKKTKSGLNFMYLLLYFKINLKFRLK